MLGTTQLTTAEKLMITENLRAARNCVAKCDAYQEMAQDQEVRHMVHAVRNTAQQHVNALSHIMQQAGFSPQS